MSISARLADLIYEKLGWRTQTALIVVLMFLCLDELVWALCSRIREELLDRGLYLP